MCERNQPILYLQNSMLYSDQLFKSRSSSCYLPTLRIPPLQNYQAILQRAGAVQFFVCDVLHPMVKFKIIMNSFVKTVATACQSSAKG